MKVPDYEFKTPEEAQKIRDAFDKWLNLKNQEIETIGGYEE